MLSPCCSCSSRFFGGFSRRAPTARRLLVPRIAAARVSPHRNWTKIDDDDSKPYADYEPPDLPLGESDLTHRATVSFLSKDMQQEQLLSVKTISSWGFRLADNSFLVGPIAVFPKTALSWRVASPAEITPESLELFLLLQPKLDVLIIGAGDRKDVDAVRRQIAPVLSRERIGYEIMTTEEAIPTFNFLNGMDNRCVAAALFPPKDIKISEEQHAQFIRQIKTDQITEPERYFFLPGVLSHVSRTMCEKIWGYSPESERAFEIISELRSKGKLERYDRVQKKLEKEKLERLQERKLEDQKQREEADRELDEAKSAYQKALEENARDESERHPTIKERNNEKDGK